MDNVVSTQWLADNLESPHVRVLDASWHLPTTKRSGKAEFNERRIPGSQFFDIDALSDTSSTLPHMLPTPAFFGAGVGALGIANQHKVVCYDSAGLFSAARCWWMFKVFGHDNVAALDGGLPKWLNEKRAIETATLSPPQSQNFKAILRPAMVKSREEVKAAIAGKTAQLADARGAGRFQGLEPEPRAGLRAGHMPGAANVHYATLLQADGTLKPTEDLRAVFASAGVDLNAPVITTCGSGVTAAILSLAMTLLNVKSHSLYDGSWTDWGSAPDTEIVTGV